MKIVIDIPEKVKEEFDKANKNDINFSFYDYNSVIGKAIRNGTPLSTERTGHWILYEECAIWGRTYKCSECKTMIDIKTNYCPYCGARMVGDNNEID